jgi:hypothetical protein
MIAFDPSNVTNIYTQVRNIPLIADPLPPLHSPARLFSFPFHKIEYPHYEDTLWGDYDPIRHRYFLLTEEECTAGRRDDSASFSRIHDPSLVLAATSPSSSTSSAAINIYNASTLAQIGSLRYDAITIQLPDAMHYDAKTDLLWLKWTAVASTPSQWCGKGTK